MVVTKQVKTTLLVASGAHWKGRLNDLSESYLRSCSPPGTETFQCEGEQKWPPEMAKAQYQHAP